MDPDVQDAGGEIPQFDGEAVRALLRLYIEEDVGPGDVTSLYSLPDPAMMVAATMVSHAGLVTAGGPFMPLLLDEVCGYVTGGAGPPPACEVLVAEGDRILPGTRILRAEGRADVLLAFERIALNMVSRMSAIATRTAEVLARCRKVNPSVTVAATRKTTPGFRFFEKWAVMVGGGSPHRYGLFDMALIKDNHSLLAGGADEAVRTAMAGMPGDNAGPRPSGPAGGSGDPGAMVASGDAQNLLRGPGPLRSVTLAKSLLSPFPPGPSGGRKYAIEAEVEDPDAALAVAAMGVDVLMLDNFTPEQAAETYRRVKAAHPDVWVEISGGLTPENVERYAGSADVLSMGSITHSVQGADISMDMKRM